MVAHGPGGTADPSLSLETDESGEYSGTLWAASDYYLALVSPSGVAAGSQRAFLSGSSEVVDFHISSREIRGRVVDQEGEPVEGAAVMLVWNVMSHVGTRTGAEGRFAFPLREEAGEAEVYARRIREPASETVSLAISPGEPIPPVTLTLPDPPRIEGRLLSAFGQAVPGARVWSYRSSATGAPTPVGRDTTGPAGSFAVPPAADAPTWIYASGPGCPLSLHAPPPLADGEVAELRCPDAASALRLHMLDAEGDGLAARRLILRHDGRVIPSEVLAGHLAALGLPVGSDGRGRLVLAGVAPGEYDLYLRDASNEATVAQGLRYGFVVSTTLRPLAATDLEVVVEEAP